MTGDSTVTTLPGEGIRRFSFSDTMPGVIYPDENGPACWWADVAKVLASFALPPQQTVSREPIALDVLRKTYSDASNLYFYQHQHDGRSKTEMHDARFDAGMLAVYDLQLAAIKEGALS